MHLHPPRARLATFSFLLVPALCACSSRPDPTPQPVEPMLAAPVAPAAAAEQEDEDAISGKSLYQRHCAGCHNDNGDGRGATILAQGSQARSFAQGGFAFGNTPEAIFDTITSGIPGSSLMQPFNAVMDEDERRMVAEYVLTLTPYGNPVLAAGSILVVKERAEFARGKLPAMREGLPEHPRGLMVGLPGGASFEYRVDDVRLIAMRRGGFVDRTDWNGRGGGELQPLGEIAFEPVLDDQQAALSAYVGQGWVPIELELSATRSAGPNGEQAQVESRPKPGSPPGIRRVIETLYQPRLSQPDSFGRRLVLDRGGAAAQADPKAFQFVVADWGDRSEVKQVRHWAGKQGIPGANDGWMVFQRSKDFICLHLDLGDAPGVTQQGNPRFISVSLSNSVDPKALPVAFDVVVVRVNSWDEALLQRMSKELGR